eukprot:112099_1
MEYTATIQSQQRDALAKALNDQKHADVTFVIGTEKTEYNTNRFLLSLISPVFDAMLYGHMKESKSNSDVIIPDVEPQIFECILNYSYANDPKITLQNVLSLLKTCDKYQIDSLSKICLNYFRSCVTQNNFCTYFVEAIKFNLTNAISVCLEYLHQLQHLEVQNILKSDGFLKMNVKVMMTFLKTDPLQITEEELWEAVVKWANYQSINNSQLESKSNDDMKYDDTSDLEEQKLYLLKTVRFLIRFGLMNGKVFATQVIPQNVLTNNELLCILLYFQNPDAKCGSFSTKQRCTDEINVAAVKSDESVYYRVKVSFCDSKTGDIDGSKYNFKFFPSKYSLRQIQEYFQSQMSKQDVRIWLKFRALKDIYPVENKNVKLTKEEFSVENHEKWMEVPDDYMIAELHMLHKTVSELCITIETKHANGTWPRIQNETIQTGDIIDARDSQHKWYESWVRFVYPDHSDNHGKCIIHYIGWHKKHDCVVDVSSESLA